MKKSKTALIRKITKSLRSMPKKKLAMLCYEMTKSKLPRLRTTKQKALPKRKTKRKFSKKQLAAQRLFAKRARAGTLRRRKR
jgi:predicted transcriptional regulator YheO